jgi:hypothetical protein
MIRLTHKDLRIGNKVQKDNGEIFTVLRLDNSDDILVEEQRSLLTLGHNLFGIPLTKEVLIFKFGFEFEVKYGFREIYWLKNTFRVEVCADGRVAVYYTSDKSLIAFIDYVHQLENLYFALTGTELIYTP